MEIGFDSGIDRPKEFEIFRASIKVAGEVAIISEVFRDIFKAKANFSAEICGGLFIFVVANREIASRSFEDSFIRSDFTLALGNLVVIVFFEIGSAIELIKNIFGAFFYIDGFGSFMVVIDEELDLF